MKVKCWKCTACGAGMSGNLGDACILFQDNCSTPEKCVYDGEQIPTNWREVYGYEIKEKEVFVKATKIEEDGFEYRSGRYDECKKEVATHQLIKLEE